MKHAANYIIQGIFVLAMLFPIQPQYAHADNGISIECQQRKTNKKKVVAKRSTKKRKAAGRKYSQKELNWIMDIIERKLQNNKQAPAVSGYGVGLNSVDVSLWWNTKENQRKFLRYVYNSPAIKFGNILDPMIDNRTETNSYRGITIKAKDEDYPVNSTKIDFIIKNESDTNIYHDDEFYVTAQNENGDWFRIPGPNIFYDVAIELESGKSHVFTAKLYPTILPNKPGIYRFFFPIHIDKKKVWLMTNFTLK